MGESDSRPVSQIQYQVRVQFPRIRHSVSTSSPSPLNNEAITPRIVGFNCIDLQFSPHHTFTNLLPTHRPQFARNGPPPADPLLANQTPEMYPQGDHNPPQGWNLAGFLTIEKGPTGRGPNTTWWAGIANCFWWVDREKGVAGVIASQVLPFGDMPVFGTWMQAEGAVYAGLEG